MKKIKLITTLLLSLLILNTACSKDDDSVKEQESSNFEFVDVKVILPNDSNLDLTKTKVHTYSEEFDVSSNGDVNIYHNTNGRHLATLMDKNGNPILMGFITDLKKEISIQTTIEVSLYYGLGVVYYPEDAREMYFEQSNQLNGFEDLVEIANTQFITNTAFLTSESFISALREKITILENEREKIDIRNSKLSVDKGDIKSGLQVEEVDFQNILLVNRYRRRAHGFIYKTSFVNQSDVSTSLINDIVQEQAGAKKGFIIDPAPGFRSPLDIFSQAISGSDVYSRTPPQELKLEDNEKEATYKVRVIGPTFGLGNITDVEEKKLRQLEWETLGYDIALPLLLDVVGHADLLKGLDKNKFKPFVDALTLLASSISSVNKPLNEGEYKKAMSALLTEMKKNASSNKFNQILEALRDGILSSINPSDNISVQSLDKIKSAANSFLNVLKAVDIILQVGDYVKIVLGIGNSNMLEEWTIKASASKVTLTPKQPVAFYLVEEPITVSIKDTPLASGQVFKYNWKTSGKYGVLKDDMNEGVEFSNGSTTPNKEIIYLSQTENADLPEDATDQIFVDVYIKEGVEETKIGSDTITVSVRADKFVIKPDGATIKGGTDLNLYIEKSDGSDVITNNPELDFKIIWTTPAKHGALNGTSDNWTNYNDNKMIYSCFDKTAMNSEEIITARIYGKLKSASDYNLYDEITATINIDNDPKKKYFVLEDTFYIVRHSDDVCWVSYNPIVTIPSDRNFLTNSFFVKKIKNAKSYSLTVPSVIDGDGYEYGSWSWNWNNNSTQYANDSVNATDENGDPIALEGDFELFIYGGGINNCGPRYGEAVARLAATQAIGYLTITLE